MERVLAKEDVKGGWQEVSACFPIGVTHGELVEVGEERINVAVVGGHDIVAVFFET